MPHTAPTLAAKFVQKLLLSEAMGLQSFFTLMDDYILSAWVQQQVAILGADGAVATSYLLRGKRW
jgi:tRNA isopentenyl-2-thiomethyl-A-37 hydroxylase MiaE